MSALGLSFLIMIAASSASSSANVDSEHAATTTLSVGATVVDICRFQSGASLPFERTAKCASHIAYLITTGMPPAHIVSVAQRGEVSATAPAQSASTDSDNVMTVTF